MHMVNLSEPHTRKLGGECLQCLSVLRLPRMSLIVVMEVINRFVVMCLWSSVLRLASKRYQFRYLLLLNYCRHSHY